MSHHGCLLCSFPRHVERAAAAVAFRLQDITRLFFTFVICNQARRARASIEEKARNVLLSQ